MKLKGYSKKVTIISIAIIAVVAVVVYMTTRQAEIEYETYTVDRGEVVEVISATGSIAPSSKIKLQPEVSGKVVEVLAEEGAEIAKGDVLLQLDVGDINAQILAQRAALASAEARLAEYEAGPTSQEISLAERTVDTARTRLESSITAEADAKQALDNANKNLVNSRAKADTQIELRLTQFLSDMEDASISANDAVNRLTDPMFDSLNFLQFNVSNAQAESDATQTRSQAVSALPQINDAWNDAVALPVVENVEAQYEVMMPHLSQVKLHLEAVATALNYAQGLPATTLSSYQQSANTALSAVSTTQQALENDVNNLDLQLRLNDTEIISAEIAVSTAEAAVNTAANTIKTNQDLLAEAEASLELKKTGVREEVIAAQRAVVSAERARLVGLQNDYAKRRIVSPVDGVVTLVSAEVGESLTPSQTVILLNAKGNLEVTANISEIDIARISIGDQVEITLDAFTDDEVWTGTIVAIQPAETVVDNVIFYETTIRFDNEDERLRSGMTANLDIETERRDSVLRMPVRALNLKNGDMYAEVLGERNMIKKVDVEVGLETDDFVEIISGPNEGDEVVVFSSEQ
jgi:RND family efflux transporter MFP subunit